MISSKDSSKLARFSKNPIALLSGADSFLGLHLSEALLAQGCNVIALESYQEGRDTLKPLIDLDNFLFLPGTLKENINCLKGPKIDYFFKLILKKKKTPKGKLISEDVDFLKEFLELCRKNKGKALFVFEELGFREISYEFEEFLKGSKSSLAESEKVVETYAQELAEKFSLDLKIAKFKDLYGPKMDISSHDPAASLIKNVLEEEDLEIKGNELIPINPTYVGDVVFGLLKLASSVKRVKGVFYLINPESKTLLSFAEELRKIKGGKLKIVLMKEETLPYRGIESQFPSDSVEKIGWKPKINLKDGLKTTLDYFERKNQAILVPEEVKKGFLASLKLTYFKKIFFGLGKPQLTWQKAIVLIIIYSLIYFVISPGLFLFSNLSAGQDMVRGAKNYLDKGLNLQSIKEADKAYFKLIAAEQNLVDLKPISFLNNNAYFSLKEEILEAIYLKEAIKREAEALELLTSIPNLIASSEGVGYSEVELNLNLIGETLTLASDSAQAALLSYQVIKKGPISEEDILKVKDTSVQLKEMIRFLPSLFSFSGEKTYLLVFQNNLNLRPTGGLIEAVGIVTLKEGKVKEIIVERPLVFDSLLEEKLEPPEFLKENLKSDKLTLAESNFDPDLETSAKLAESLFEKETGRRVNGVIFLDLFFFEDFLKLSGKAEIPESGTKIDSENLWGEAGKEGGLETSFYSTAVERFFTIDQLDWTKSSSLLRKVLEGKHMSLFFNDQILNQFGKKYNFTGPIDKEKSDYLYVCDFNLSYDRNEALVRKSKEYKIVVDEQGGLRATLSLSYKNESDKPYKDYLRIYTPLGSEIKDIKVTNQAVVPSIKKSQAYEKEVFGLSFEVAPQEEKKIVLSYSLPFNIDQDQESYQLLVQKQPGTEKDSLSVRLELPLIFKSQEAVPEALITNSLVVWEREIVSDTVFYVKLRKSS
ncbi:MAG: hypothetical protein A2Y57_01715 [Candidatus Woykebacteria bacterium RBG_13_40_7b]|uniref:NAD-dependent epimerase/dehydratase domain-containing protein n=1 Tax=Candidatus Woykebacteria bacterium RBG_13_40_7b TaxID=1802594 RepID=A0A1G1WB01_9BACT|nr:MAG: hypothetical protein A2Y57_01715 [Candidatus Woykebacteria bacterium RBG_13_40_7b]